MIRSLGLRAPLIGILLFGLILVLGLLRGSRFAVLPMFRFPGILALLYATEADGLTGFDPVPHPMPALLIGLAPTLFLGGS